MADARLTEDRGEILLSAIYDEVDFRLNPDDEECWYCGGDGEIYDCIDGCCIDAEFGCSTCASPCPECRLSRAARAKAIREAVIKSGDIDIATAWIKSVGRWRDDITPEQIREQMAEAGQALSGKGE